MRPENWGPAVDDVDEDRWPFAIGTMSMLKQRISGLETAALIGVEAPHRPAEAAQIAAATMRVGLLPADLLDWLQHADGWPNLWFGMDLYPAAGLERADGVVQRDPVLGRQLQAMSPPLDLADLLVVGGSDHTTHRVVVSMNPTAEGVTYWLDEGSVDRYDTFFAFFETLIELHRDELADLGDTETP